MKYKGHIHRLYLMISESEKNLTKDEIIDKIYETMNSDPDIIGHITRLEIEQAVNARLGI